MNSGLSYGDFAFIYDKLTDDVEYAKRADYVELLMDRHRGSKAEIVCDLGCGTGSMCTALNGRGYDVIGIDLSDSMLSVAAAKPESEGVLYINQDMTDFELYGTADVFLSLLDSVNYITDEGSLRRMFALVKNYLNPGGVFIFDVNTRYKFETILADNTYAYETKDVFYTWENLYSGGLLEFYLNFFVKEGALYRRITEHHTQRYYSVDTLKRISEESGLSVEGIYDDLSLTPPKADSERVFFVVKKSDFLQ